ncbi:hypothetical protein [Sinomicrobium weinanense]|uniref:Uncharacterized protein n=1 Tax=Sinomicrobium weinanense TaxID=2842200 RepID=A0A926JV07_9FLAO|nr:hypothetical protein [Sinomicrobium weinanense]MBC9797712.1 hypothetical protein [Sinomicrobium weinanense]MBU3122262.1 hypothetical protein [Sinomicrobium weinanense]
MKKTDKKSLSFLSLCSLGMLLVLVGLYALSPLANQKIYRGSFNRNFAPENTVTQQKILDLGVNSYYISGLTKDKIYLSNYTTIHHLLRTDMTLKDTQHIRLKIIGLDSVVHPRKFRTRVEPPYFYMMHGIAPAILRGKVNKWEARRFMADSAYYTDAVPIDTTSFALRYYSKSQESYELALETAKEPYFKPNYDILEKQMDGFFSVDGMLHYNKELQQIVYLYRYRNQYMVMDKNLKLLHQYNTLDTISIARIKSEEIKSENSFTLTSQPTVTQRISSVSGIYLYINSGLLSQNEKEEQFKQNTVIDVYDLTQGKYIHSFYLPHYKNKGISDFKIIGNRLLAIHDQYLSVYTIATDNIIF